MDVVVIDELGYVAHTPNDRGEWHSLKKHLLDVATRTRAWAEPFGAGDLAYWAGLLHDLGKYSCDFQRYLRECERAARTGATPPRPGSAPHKQVGAIAVQQAEFGLPPLAPIIFGHHGGLPNVAELPSLLADPRIPEVAPILKKAAEDCVELATRPGISPSVLRALCPDRLTAEMLLRMVFSCLVDADSLDTERHGDLAPGTVRARPMPSLETLREQLRQNQEQLQASAPATSLNKLRAEVYTACREAAALPPGVFKLTVPTGGGKTRSSLAFALEHAVRHGLERVIYAIPYTSIVDQTTEVFEQIFGEGTVLEHHSAIEPDDDAPQQELWRRLASQNWDAPLIVTTTVQLFESLFSNRPGRCRKVHRLARAVIVLDEVQSLPPTRLQALVDGLRVLCERFGSTVLLCTATQPALDRDALESVGFGSVREIAPDPGRLFRELKRVTYDISPLAESEGWTWERVATEMRQSPACLTIVNTRRHALDLLDALNDPEALHLSTLLCGRHRRDVLAKIRRRLASGEPCRLVATQVVEAGVDLDFPRVLRALGPLDRIVQAAGRCNREGRRPAAESRVVIFRPAAAGTPRGSYRTGIEAASKLLRRGADLHNPELYEHYFRTVFRRGTLDEHGIQKLRAEWDFPRVAEKMRLIEDDTVGVLVRYAPYAGEIDQLLERIQSAPRMTRALWQEAQPFMVALRRREFDGFRKRGLVTEVRNDGSQVWRWWGAYDPIRGLGDGRIEPGELVV
jgi:CRISPR-associated endonuclease/helicase Cas3